MSTSEFLVRNSLPAVKSPEDLAGLRQIVDAQNECSGVGVLRRGQGAGLSISLTLSV